MSTCLSDQERWHGVSRDGEVSSDTKPLRRFAPAPLQRGAKKGAKVSLDFLLENMIE